MILCLYVCTWLILNAHFKLQLNDLITGLKLVEFHGSDRRPWPRTVNNRWSLKADRIGQRNDMEWRIKRSWWTWSLAHIIQHCLSRRHPKQIQTSSRWHIGNTALNLNLELNDILNISCSIRLRHQCLGSTQGAVCPPYFKDACHQDKSLWLPVNTPSHPDRPVLDACTFSRFVADTLASSDEEALKVCLNIWLWIFDLW